MLEITSLRKILAIGYSDHVSLSDILESSHEAFPECRHCARKAQPLPACKATWGRQIRVLEAGRVYAGQWPQLAHDIRQQILAKEAVSVKQTAYGEYFEISASLTGPNRVVVQLKTIWMRESKSGITKFITLYANRVR